MQKEKEKKEKHLFRETCFFSVTSSSKYSPHLYPSFSIVHATHFTCSKVQERVFRKRASLVRPYDD